MALSNGGETRAEATDQLIWRVALHNEVHGKENPNELPENTTAESLRWCQADRRGVRTCGRFAAKTRPTSPGRWYHPVWGSTLHQSHRLFHLGGTFMYLFHTCTHSQFRDAQFGISVCVSRVWVRTSAASYRQKPLLRCQRACGGLSVTGKSKPEM